MEMSRDDPGKNEGPTYFSVMLKMGSFFIIAETERQSSLDPCPASVFSAGRWLAEWIDQASV